MCERKIKYNTNTRWIHITNQIENKKTRHPTQLK